MVETGEIKFYRTGTATFRTRGRGGFLSIQADRTIRLDRVTSVTWSLESLNGSLYLLDHFVVGEKVGMHAFQIDPSTGETTSVEEYVDLEKFETFFIHRRYLIADDLTVYLIRWDGSLKKFASLLDVVGHRRQLAAKALT